MSSGPSNDPVIQQLQLLLTGYGYNFYNVTNQARADDLLVRERASYHLAQAVEMLSLTRANPDPPQEAMAQVREIEATQQALANVETQIRGMAVPTQDRTWWRFRQEQALLAQLLQFDLGLVRSSEQVYQYVSQLTPDNWNTQGSMPLRQMIQQLMHLARERERFLLLPM